VCLRRFGRCFILLLAIALAAGGEFAGGRHHSSNCASPKYPGTIFPDQDYSSQPAKRATSAKVNRVPEKKRPTWPARKVATAPANSAARGRPSTANRKSQNLRLPTTRKWRSKIRNTTAAPSAGRSTRPAGMVNWFHRPYAISTTGISKCAPADGIAHKYDIPENRRMIISRSSCCLSRPGLLSRRLPFPKLA